MTSPATGQVAPVDGFPGEVHVALEQHGGVRARSREGTLTFITLPRPSDLRRIAGSVILLLAGVLSGVISVYSGTCVGCASG